MKNAFKSLKFLSLACLFGMLLTFSVGDVIAQGTCGTATPITDGACLTGQNMPGSFSGGFAGCNGGSTPVRFYSFTAPASGDCVQFDITNPSVDGKWEAMIYTAGCASYVAGSGGCIENVKAGKPFSISGVNSSGATILTPGSNYVLILSADVATTFDICFTSPSVNAPSNECSGAISLGAASSFYNGGDCRFTGSFDDASTTDPSPASLLCAGSLENTQWLTFTAASSANITLTGSNISCTGGGCGFQFGIFSAGVGGTCCGALTHLGCYGNKVCTGGQAVAGPTDPIGRVTWTSTSSSGFTVTISGVTAGEVFCFVMDGNADADCSYNLTATGILPIGLTGFEGYEEDNGIMLHWTTETEVNSERIEVMRSLDGEEFEVIATLAAAGNSQGPIHYSFKDEYPSPGKNFYRLRMVDINGSQLNSQSISVGYRYQDVQIGTQEGGITLYLGSSVLERAPLTLRIMSLTGQLMMEKNLTDASFQTVVPTEGIRPGPYLLSLTGDHFRTIRKVQLK